MASATVSVSQHPLVPLVERKDALQAWCGATILVVTACVLVLFALGRSNLEGTFEVMFISVPWIIFIWPLVHVIYYHQKKVSFLRPTGFWYGLLDFLPSIAVAIIATYIMASLASVVFPTSVGAAFLLLHLPVAPYSATSLVVAVLFCAYSYADVFYYHWRRAEFGKERLLEEEYAPTVSLPLKKGSEKLEYRYVPIVEPVRST